jgi:hypothetical protein
MFRGPGPAKYLLPGTCGYSVHDPRKNKKPAYSFGLKLGKNVKNTGPGPAYLVPSSITRRGKDGTPAYTLHDRTSLLQSFQTPAPGKELFIAITNVNCVWTNSMWSYYDFSSDAW